jgi:transposase-like protein
VWHTRPRKMATPANSDKNHCFPVEIMHHAVWLDVRCGLSDCEVEEWRCARGLTVTDEAMRRGAGSLANRMPSNCDADGLSWGIHGIVTRSC